MKKIYLQIALNFAIICISGVVIYVSKCFAVDAFVGISECLGADFVFALISAILSTLGWRIVEEIRCKCLTVFTTAYLAFSVFVYGVALAAADRRPVLMSWFVRADFYIFLGVYLLENISIILTMRKRFKRLPSSPDGRHGDNCSYRAADLNT